MMATMAYCFLSPNNVSIFKVSIKLLNPIVIPFWFLSIKLEMRVKNYSSNTNDESYSFLESRTVIVESIILKSFGVNPCSYGCLIFSLSQT